LVVSALCICFMVSAGCEEDKMEVCCQCTCYVVEDRTRDKIEYERGTNINCNSACDNLCENGLHMESENPKSVDCATMPTDN
jgi:hypothetical protein